MDSILHRKERLIITTIEIIDELGIQGLSTREIARRQGISEATLFRHYKNKNKLLEAVLDYFSQYDEDIFTSSKIKALAPLDALVYVITSYATYYENYPAITSIMQIFDVLLRETELTDKVKSILSKRDYYIKSLIEDAQTCGEISNDTDSDMIAEIISGFISEICMKWRLENYTFSLRDRILSVLKFFLDALK